MDSMGGGRVLRPSPCGGISYRLAGMGPPNVGDCDANHEIPSRECRSRGCCAAARPGWMATTCTQPHHSVCDPCQRGLLSHTPYNRTEPGVARSLHRCASLRALFVMGLGRRRARWCGANGDCGRHGRRHLDDGKRCLGREMAQCELWRVGRDNAEGFKSSIPASKSPSHHQTPKMSRCGKFHLATPSHRQASSSVGRSAAPARTTAFIRVIGTRKMLCNAQLVSAREIRVRLQGLFLTAIVVALVRRRLRMIDRAVIQTSSHNR